MKHLYDDHFSDPIIPKKEAFIKSKYLHMAYTIRPLRDEESTSLDLNRQLWACVRTSRVETTLRLLALGADPNYSESEKGICPLHVAAKEGQMLQAELLWIVRRYSLYMPYILNF